MNIMAVADQPASMTIWKSIPQHEQMELVDKAIKRETYIASVYGIKVTKKEILGQTWIGICERLEADRLRKDNAKRELKGKQPLTVKQIAYRAAHSAIERRRYDYLKHKWEPLEYWQGADDGRTEERIIDRLVFEDFAAQRNERDQNVLAMRSEGYTEREAGKYIGISGVAVHNRLAKMRKELRVVLA